jgi:hypothetical protein
MNPRRVHELMLKHFPRFAAVDLAWKNFVERDGSIRRDELLAMIDTYIQADEVLVEVNRKTGGFLSKKELLEFIRDYMGQGTIRMMDRDYSGFVVLAASGVAAGWAGTPNSTLHTDAQTRQ